MRSKINKTLAVITAVLFFNASAGFARVTPELETIRQFFLKGEYDHVIERMQYIDLDQGSTAELEALYFIGVSLIKVGRFSEGRDILSRIIQRKPKIKFRDQVELRMADSFLAENALDIALKRYQEIMTKYPDSSGLAHAYEQSALICQRLGQFDQADSYFKLLQINAPLSSEAAAARRGLTKKVSHFGVQVGSFTDLGTAEILKTELETKGFHPSIQTIQKNESPLYHVVVGEFSSRQEAEGEAKKMESLGYPVHIYP